MNPRCVVAVFVALAVSLIALCCVILKVTELLTALLGLVFWQIAFEIFDN